MPRYTELSWENMLYASPKRGHSRALALLAHSPLHQQEAYLGKQIGKGRRYVLFSQICSNPGALSAVAISGEHAWIKLGQSSSIPTEMMNCTEPVQLCCILYWILFHIYMYGTWNHSLKFKLHFSSRGMGKRMK